MTVENTTDNGKPAWLGQLVDSVRWLGCILVIVLTIIIVPMVKRMTECNYNSPVVFNELTGHYDVIDSTNSSR